MSEAGFRREGIGSRLPLDGAALFGRGRGGVRWPGTNAIGFETGRAAIGWLSDALGLGPGDRALLPAYLCESVVAPFRSRGVAVDFYRVDARLAPDAADARARLTPQTRILMVIHYFGFPLPQAQLAPMPHAPGLVRLEDWVQGPLTAGALAVDRGFGEYRVLAWHKVLPVPDSGLLLRRADVPPPPRCPPLRAPRAAFFGRRLLAKFLKAVAVRIAGGAPSALYRPLFDAAERAAGAGVPVRMSRLSRRILAGADLAGVTRRRRDNFLRLAEALRNVPGVALLRDAPPEGVCPLGLPVRVAGRDRVLPRLLAARIYAPVHWALPPEVDPSAFPEAAAVAADEITLPIDQRYGAPEMAFIARTLVAAVRGRTGERVA